MVDVPRGGLDLTGQRFGKLVAVECAGVRGKVGTRRLWWLCKCDCGRDHVTASTSLRTGSTRSCGCLRRDAHAAERAQVARLWPMTDGKGHPHLSASEIGAAIGITKNAVVGHVHRLCLAPRPSPIKRRTTPLPPKRIMLDPRGQTLPPLPSLAQPLYIAPSLRP